jgi:hypothetical protein
MIPEEHLVQFDGYQTWYLEMLLEEKEKWLYTLEFCTCEDCMKFPPEKNAEWIDETRQIIIRVRAELERRGCL